jgi:Golgi phosphoprotein 3 (GPP34)
MANLELAEQFFLIGHDEFSGKPAVSIELIQCGLVGALFGELIIERRLAMKDNKIAVLDAAPTDGGFADRLVATVDSQRTTHRVRTWAEQLGPEAYKIIADRLVEAGTLRREHGRKLLGGSGERYPAVDTYAAARPRLTLTHVISHREEMDLPQAVLACLLAAVGIEPVLGLDMNRDALRNIINSLLKAMPSELQALMAGVDETVASISLTIHR